MEYVCIAWFLHDYIYIQFAAHARFSKCIRKSFELISRHISIEIITSNAHTHILTPIRNSINKMSFLYIYLTWECENYALLCTHMPERGKGRERERTQHGNRMNCEICINLVLHRNGNGYMWNWMFKFASHFSEEHFCHATPFRLRCSTIGVLRMHSGNTLQWRPVQPVTLAHIE